MYYQEGMWENSSEKKDGATTPSLSTGTTGHLRNVKEDLFEDATSDDADAVTETPSKDF
jgi:hypothetical protein